MLGTLAGLYSNITEGTERLYKVLVMAVQPECRHANQTRIIQQRYKSLVPAQG